MSASRVVSTSTGSSSSAWVTLMLSPRVHGRSMTWLLSIFIVVPPLLDWWNNPGMSCPTVLGERSAPLRRAVPATIAPELRPGR